MKTISTLFLSLIFMSGVLAQSEKRASPMQSTKATVGDAEISITYSSPSKKGREIYGGLVPFDKIWRTGANEATVFTTSQDIRVNGQDLAAGTYALFTIPGEENWTIIFNKNAKQWGAYNYDKSQDALRVTAETEEIEETEAFTIEAMDDGHIYLDWDTTRAVLEIE